ncbi:MAG: homocysteine S-methyltransferase family protein [Deltaproteobacteria bacterium]|nr:homocysteine S-methyltransferase family protein [Deltaproteobacteria bacterium]
MNRNDFKNLLSRRVLVLDGAYGTEFFKMGLGDLPGEILNLKHPDAVYSLQKSYVESGSDILLTNTFSANSRKLKALGYETEMEKINIKAVEIARKASNSNTLVFGDISSTGEFPVPAGLSDFDECVAIYRDQARVLAGAGVDGFIVETMSDIKELKAALLGIREITQELPLIVHMTFDETARSVTGTPPEAFAALFNDLDCDVIGINCSLGPEQTLEIIRKISPYTTKHLSVEPNAGKPVFDGITLTYKETPEDFALFAEDFINSGCSIIGGCCGTTPDHIKLLSHFAHRVKPSIRPEKVPQIVTSRTSWAEIDPFLIIGERINPAGRQRFQKSIYEGDFKTALEEAKSQQRQHAQVLDINLGIEKLVPPEQFVNIINELDRNASLPLSLDIQTPSLMELAARNGSGRMILNSARVTEKNLPRRIGMLKKYGGMLVLLAMGKEIPETPEGRFNKIMEGIALCESEGISRDRILADPLVMSFGAGKDPAVTLETIRLLTEEGIKTTCGLSNLSFGMPDRSYLNGSFLVKAVDRGLKSAIMNPGDDFVMNSLHGALSLDGHQMTHPDMEVSENELVRFLLEGNSEKLLEAVKTYETDNDPVYISQNILGGAMEEIGILYGEGKIYLPHLLLASETSAPVFEYLNSQMTGSVISKGKILLATVEGDVHDIGKRIIGTVLKTGGFEVFDLGKDVSSRTILEEAREIKPDIIGLSAMMTTTVSRVQEVTTAIHSAGLSPMIICGGASMTKELAGKFGADGYAPNASTVVELCLELLKKQTGQEKSGLDNK